MGDPPRLVEDGGSNFVCALITAAREEAPKIAAVERTLAATRAASTAFSEPKLPAVAPAHTVAQRSDAIASDASELVPKSRPIQASSSALGLVVKWLAIGAVLGIVVSTAAYSLGDVFASAPNPEPGSDGGVRAR
ncbi:MAG TPA: hypothetical protein VHV51_22920 [Polyangiaceae bacterium]|jgi:hypothetical protein|nr:hypothetical protein [Polyangiaceae bacterium]